jgi:hypothetical protein
MYLQGGAMQINGIEVTFTGDRRKKAAEIVAMFDRLAVRPAPDDGKREPAEAPVVLELSVKLSVPVLA